MPTLEKEFGFLPYKISIKTEFCSISVLPDYDDRIEKVKKSNPIHFGSVYPKLPDKKFFSSGDRFFHLPPTHLFTLKDADGDLHIDFLLSLLSFFIGIRLVTSNSGNLDCNFIEKYRATDFFLYDNQLAIILEHAQRFWQENLENPTISKLLISAVFSFFLSHSAVYFEEEKYWLLCKAVDTCFKLEKTRGRFKAENIKQESKSKKLCKIYGIPTDCIIKHEDQITAFSDSDLRNEFSHASMYDGELFLHFNYFNKRHDNKKGFIHRRTDHLLTEKRRLFSRFIVGLIGICAKEYLKTDISCISRKNLFTREEIYSISRDSICDIENEQLKIKLPFINNKGKEKIKNKKDDDET